MNSITKFMSVFIVAGVLIGTINFSTIASAEKPTDPDCFGEEASQLGKGGDMGDHSKAGSVAGEPPFDSDGEGDDDKPGRQGIGNVGGEGSETHPSELAEGLNQGETCDED
ncbi:MAG TPA: hypothetical protein VFX75_02740 [Nitrososphaeraceae archaeon]|nr:hypothetical protein [Nitrososphaeraceae archaeon]